MLGNHEQSAIIPARDDLAPRRSSGISTAPPRDTLETMKRDFASEWIHSAMQASKQTHGDEDFRREVARGFSSQPVPHAQPPRIAQTGSQRRDARARHKAQTRHSAGFVSLLASGQ
jgi:hypothetical protein